MTNLRFAMVLGLLVIWELPVQAKQAHPGS
jgi:hypothetical protein